MNSNLTGAKLQRQLDIIYTDVIAYNTKPTKTLSAKIRVSLGNLKKDITSIRAELVAADRLGYK